MSPPSIDQRVEDAAADYLRAVDAGGAPSRDEFLARHPDLAAELGEFLDDLARFGVLSTPRAGPDTPADPAATATFDGTATAELPDGPVRIADYEVRGVLGRGGMGVVYRARQISLNRPVALKMIAPDRLEGRAERERFLREAEAAAALDHPHIVPIYDVGEAAGRSYFTMKLVEGGSLADLRREGPRTAVRGLVTLLSQVARAVHYAHQRGILHRDLKPSNILLGPAGEPLVADFGLAKRLDGPADVSKSGVVIGTPAYMAPEQARGEKDLTTAADVYGLGAILYELLTGRPPFWAPSPAETLVLVLGGDPARPRSLNPSVPSDLEAICLKCLAKDPATRYASAEGLADDLDHWRKGEPTAARPARAAERAVKWARRNPAVMALAGVGLLAAGAMIWGVLAEAYNSELSTAKRRLEDTNQGLVKANELRNAALSELARQHAETGRLRDLAEGERGRAQTERETARQLLYVARFRQAEQAWRDGRPALASALLFDSPEAARLRRFAGIEEPLSGIGPVGVRPVRVPWVAPPRNQTAEPTHTIRLVDLTPDGRTAVLAQPTGGVSWWDVETGARLGWTDRLGLAVTDVRATPTHTLVSVTVSGGSELRIFDHRSSPSAGNWLRLTADLVTRRADASRSVIEIPAGQTLRTWAVSRDAPRVAAACGDGKVRVWSVPDGKPLAEIPNTVADVVSVAMSADGSRVARGGAEPAVWTIGSSRPDWVVSKREAGADWRAVAFHPDGKVVAVATERTVELWTLGSDMPLHVVGEQAGVTALEFGPDGHSLLAVEAGRRATVWDFRGRPLAAFVPDRAPLFRARLVAGGAVFAAGGQDHPLDVHRVGFGRPESAVVQLPESAHSVAFSPNGERVVATLRDGSVRVWESADGRSICKLQAGARFGYSRAVFSPCGRMVAVGSTREVFLCDATDGRIVTKLSAEMKGEMAYIYDVAFSPDGNLLAAGTAGTVTVWDLRTSQIVHNLRERALPGVRMSAWMVTVGFSPDGRFLATGGGSWDSDGTGRSLGYLTVWDVQTGQPLFVSPGQPDGIYGLAWSPDGRWVASGSGRYQFGGPGGVHVWEPATGREVFDLKGHTQCVWAVTFSPDGRRLVSAGGPWRSPYPGDKRQKIPHGAAEVRVWDMRSGQELLSANLHTATAYGAAFAPDGKWFATAGWDKVMRVWKLTSEAEDVASRSPERGR